MNSSLQILFSHGAGASSQSAWMLSWRARLGTIAPTETFNYDYMERGKKAPDRLPKLLTRHSSALDALEVPDGQVVLAGKSMGSRVGCHLALERSVAGLICFGYPLVGRSSVRDQVLLELERPILFIQGTKDKLCPIEQLNDVRAKMTARNELHVVSGGNHSLIVGKRQLKAEGRTQDEIDDEIAFAVRDFVSTLSAQASPMEPFVQVQCPYCFEEVTLYVDPQSQGSFVEDCEVCCRPWQVHTWRGDNDALQASVSRAQ